MLHFKACFTQIYISLNSFFLPKYVPQETVTMNDDGSIDTPLSTDHSWDDDSSEDDDIDLLNTDSVSSDDHVINDKGNLVLELHDIRREGATANLQEPKSKRFRKKKQSKPKSKTGQSSSRSSEGSFPLQNADGREEFYDAHESYHGLTAKAISKVTAPVPNVEELENQPQQAIEPKVPEPLPNVNMQSPEQVTTADGARRTQG
ncbi:uncharacterized protein LOC113236838 isoform X2 [Hyposmocoma kahamanoa]|uniref:uncharacterized protein LOC113236838 isoform X2 n=1 Tax=Hyposmocoma kahamanoa TaxID=1477025 RepID=UPI000E6D7F4D|nr:uncharacterized protein LOC113236838 isoform X2 [Hyposmocoma kahamanoa]